VEPQPLPFQQLLYSYLTLGQAGGGLSLLFGANVLCRAGSHSFPLQASPVGSHCLWWCPFTSMGDAIGVQHSKKGLPCQMRGQHTQRQQHRPSCIQLPHLNLCATAVTAAACGVPQVSSPQVCCAAAGMAACGPAHAMFKQCVCGCYRAVEVAGRCVGRCWCRSVTHCCSLVTRAHQGHTQGGDSGCGGSPGETEGQGGWGRRSRAPQGVAAGPWPP
jgi:hypothetical protein